MSMTELMCYGHKQEDQVLESKVPMATAHEFQQLTQVVREFQASLQAYQQQADGAQAENLQLQQRVQQLERANLRLQAELDEYESQMSFVHLDVLEAHYRSLEQPQLPPPSPLRRRLPSLRGIPGIQVTSIATPTLTPANSTKSLLASGNGGKLPSPHPVQIVDVTKPLTMADAVQDLASRPSATSFEWPQQ